MGRSVPASSTVSHGGSIDYGIAHRLPVSWSIRCWNDSPIGHKHGLAWQWISASSRRGSQPPAYPITLYYPRECLDLGGKLLYSARVGSCANWPSHSWTMLYGMWSNVYQGHLVDNPAQTPSTLVKTSKTTKRLEFAPPQSYLGHGFLHFSSLVV